MGMDSAPGKAPFRKKLARLPIAPGEWEGGWFHLGDILAVESLREELGVVLLVDPAGEIVIGAEPMDSRSAEEVARRLIGFMLRPAKPARPCRPAVLRVRDSDLRGALRDLTGDALPEITTAGDFAYLDTVAADLSQTLAALHPPREIPPLPDDEQTGLLFKAAAVFYNAKPWRVLADEVPVRVQIGTEVPRFAAVLGGAGMTFGLALFHDTDAMQTQASLFEAQSIALTFGAESEVPQEWRALRRRRKWPIASPSAFPVPLAHDGGAATTPSLLDLRTLEVALAGVAGLVARHSKQIEKGLSAEFSFEVPDRGRTGAPETVTVSTNHGAAKRQTPANPDGLPGLDEISAMALSLPDARDALDRLAWSFFRDSQPSHAETQREQEASVMRFFDWALFAARVRGQTLAQRALAAAGDEIDAKSRAVCERLVHPRFGMFRVERVERNAGLDVRDLATGDVLRVRERSATRKVSPRNALLGMLHPVSDEEFVMSGSIVALEDAPDVPLRAGQGAIEDVPPLLEAELFGAGEDWIQHTNAAGVRRAYGAFRAALSATGDTLPTYETLQTRIRKAEAPGDIFSAVSEEVTWWTEAELAVMLGFLMRIWNLTPRPELGEKSPDQMAKRGRKRRR
ncbi:MAG: DUF6930 domain-containing protein [Gemmatimonadaceae bacterium]